MPLLTKVLLLLMSVMVLLDTLQNVQLGISLNRKQILELFDEWFTLLSIEFATAWSLKCRAEFFQKKG